jgi:thymidylate synthase (FAD)
MQQWYKHVVGIETTSSYLTKDHAWNEISERYIPVEEHYISENWRQQSEDSKQASIGAIAQQQEATKATAAFLQVLQVAKHYYNKLLEFGVAKEQARVLLPLS